MSHTSLSLKRDEKGRIAQRTLNLGGEAEIRRYAYDSAGRLARVTNGSGGLLESYQYDHEGRRLADINPQRFRGERRYSYLSGNRLGQAGTAQYGHDTAGFRSLKVEASSSTSPAACLWAWTCPTADALTTRTTTRASGQKSASTAA